MAPGARLFQVGDPTYVISQARFPLLVPQRCRLEFFLRFRMTDNAHGARSRCERDQNRAGACPVPEGHRDTSPIASALGVWPQGRKSRRDG